MTLESNLRHRLVDREGPGLDVGGPVSEIWEWVVAPLGDDVRGERLKEEPLNEATLGTVHFTPHSSQSTCRYFFVHQ